MEPSPEGLTVRNISRLSRNSNEDRSATPSSATSRGKALCRACGTPGNQVTPLIACSICSRGYHDGCGNPKPRQSATPDDFVCGKCLKQRRANNSMNTGESSLSLPETATPSNEVKNKINVSSRALQGDLYKGITCPSWRVRRCPLFEAHCLFAHRETGHDVGGKAFECPAWRAGLCSKSPSECPLSHKSTGLHVDMGKRVCRKHITCYFWKRDGRCPRSFCLFGHTNTGILEWQPKGSSMIEKGVNSLSDYMCPRWERYSPGYCQWATRTGPCPYSHYATEKSCFPNPERHPKATPERSVETEESVVPPTPTLPTRSPSNSNYLPDTKTPQTAGKDKGHSVQTAVSDADDADTEHEVNASRMASQAEPAPSPKSPKVSNLQAENSEARPRIMWAKRGGRRSGPEGRRIGPRPQTPPVALDPIPQPNTLNRTNMSTAKNIEASSFESQHQKQITSRHVSSAEQGQIRTATGNPVTADNSLNMGEQQSPMTIEAHPQHFNVRKRTAEDEAGFVTSKKRFSLTTQTFDKVNRALGRSENLPRVSLDDPLDPAQLYPPSSGLGAPEILSILNKQASSSEMIGTNSPLTTKNSTIPGTEPESDSGLSRFESEDQSEEWRQGRDHELDVEDSDSSSEPIGCHPWRAMSIIPSIESESDADAMGSLRTSTGPRQRDSPADLVNMQVTPRLETSFSRSVPIGTSRPLLGRSTPPGPPLPKLVSPTNTARVEAGADLAKDNHPRAVSPPNPMMLLKQRCGICIRRHQRCFHSHDGSDYPNLDPQKCWLFLQIHTRQQKARIVAQQWQKIQEAAKMYSQSNEGSDALDKTLLGEKSNLSVTGEADGTHLVESTSKAGENGHHPTSEREARNYQTSAPNGDIPLAQLRSRHPNQPEALNLARDFGRRETLAGRRGDRHGTKENGSMADSDQQQALNILREHGIMIDSDSDEIHSEDGEQPSHHSELVTDPLHYRAKSRNLFDLDRSLDIRDPENYWAALGEIPPWQKNKPTRKQLMKNNNLLKWQMWRNQQRFGNPHTETLKLASEVPCKTVIVRQHPLDTGDLESTPRTEVVESHMSFSEFVGLPSKPIVEYGRNDDELIIREGKDEVEVEAEIGGLVRRRRTREEDKFPFVYDVTQAKRGG
ncbi:hypothetical protein PV10_05870 [Exophiala mesophila]|uniref:PHD-type domain-containing protein n=1 Tax=Exophiala mesophila TaxID=212818 RepID=A0A0D1ZBE4_EXOME|nr:uncharacterized protein PV10_05870 [Exophiala mesophila]KIV91319.1 hypothetical protein PV10_05870 [Exophiala mesophila]